MKRKLASIQRIWNIEPIADSDFIELASVMGWKCVVAKNKFKKGDLCVYLEVDSFIPAGKPDFEFLGSPKNSPIFGSGYRITAKKIRGVVSMGLIMPLDILITSGNPDVYNGKVPTFELGSDVTDFLGILKWEEEEKASSSGVIIGDLPYGIPKTDEMRVQSYPALIDEFKHCGEYYISTKMDGTSVTMYWMNNKFGVCGRNYEYKDTADCSMWKYAHENNIENKLKLLYWNVNMAIQGEFCGPGIQGNRLKLIKPEWYVFTIIDLDSGKRISLDNMIDICMYLELNHVPIEERSREFKYNTVDELIERAKGKYSSGNNKEGIVIRPTSTRWSPTIVGQLTGKVLNNDYLLKLK